MLRGTTNTAAATSKTLNDRPEQENDVPTAAAAASAAAGWSRQGPAEAPPARPPLP